MTLNFKEMIPRVIGWGLIGLIFSFLMQLLGLTTTPWVGLAAGIIAGLVASLKTNIWAGFIASIIFSLVFWVISVSFMQGIIALIFGLSSGAVVEAIATDPPAGFNKVIWIYISFGLLALFLGVLLVTQIGWFQQSTLLNYSDWRIWGGLLGLSVVWLVNQFVLNNQ